MLKTAKMTGAVHTNTHTGTYLENKKEIAYKVCFNNDVYQTDQLV